jgi:hypothetical protein
MVKTAKSKTDPAVPKKTKAIAKPEDKPVKPRRTRTDKVAIDALLQGQGNID